MIDLMQSIQPMLNIIVMLLSLINVMKFLLIFILQNISLLWCYLHDIRMHNFVSHPPSKRHLCICAFQIAFCISASKPHFSFFISSTLGLPDVAQVLLCVWTVSVQSVYSQCSWCGYKNSLEKETPIRTRRRNETRQCCARHTVSALPHPHLLFSNSVSLQSKPHLSFFPNKKINLRQVISNKQTVKTL